MLFWLYNSLRYDNMEDLRVSMLVISHTITNMKRNIRTDYKNIQFYYDNRAMTNQREVKWPEMACLLHLRDLIYELYPWFLIFFMNKFMFERKFLSAVFVFVYNGYHRYTPTNKLNNELKQYKFQNITFKYYTMIIY